MGPVDFHYVPTDDELRAYARFTPLERLKRLDDLRRFTLMLRHAPTVGRRAAEPGPGRAYGPDGEAAGGRAAAPGASSAMGGRFAAAIAAFDAANAADPRCERAGGVEQSKELAYARRMSEMLERFAPDTSEAVRLAVRCQHIRRWEIPRESYPRTPEGYKAWRARLMAFHAETAGRILREVGYDEGTVAHVQALLRKERLKREPDSQLVEDVVGLVFLEHYLEEFVATHPEHDEAKLADILQKTWLKMSPQGREAALTIAKLPEALVPAIRAAVAPT